MMKIILKQRLRSKLTAFDYQGNDPICWENAMFTYLPRALISKIRSPKKILCRNLSSQKYYFSNLEVFSP